MDDHPALRLLDALLAKSHPDRAATIRECLVKDELQSAASNWLGPPSDDTSTLAARLSRLAQLETDFANQLAAAKIEALKEFAYGAGHEINNPLANISARAQTLLRDEQHPERRRALATINRQAFRAHEMLADLMLFARPPEIVRAEFDACAVARRVVDELSPDAAAQATQLVVETPPTSLPVSADQTQVAVALQAVVRNALEALAAGGRVEVSVRGGTGGLPTSAESSPDSPSIRLGQNSHPPTVAFIVADDGPGFSPREQAHLFDPFFSGREAGRGLGFGLCKAWRIVTDHGGKIEIASQPRRGATVTITL